MNCDCPFARMHQLGATARELPGIYERAKTLTVTFIGMRNASWLFRVEGGEQARYVTMSPGGDDGSAICKHIIAARSFVKGFRCLGSKKCEASCKDCSLWSENVEARFVPEVVESENRGEVNPPGVSCAIGAVG
jgi:hypothetical protein